MHTRQDVPSTGHHQQAAHSSGPALNRSSGSAPESYRSRVLGSPADIICGRGFHIINHHGNHNLHLMVNNHRELYLSSKRDQKAKIIKLIINEIKSTGARFIRRVSDRDGVDEWEEVDDATAYKKVSHALRLRTTNESNRDGKGKAVAADKFRREADSSTYAMEQLRSNHTILPAPSAPSATNCASSHRGRQTSVLARPTDIICGRGFHIVNHRGNLNLHLMVNAHREEYLKSHRAQKAKIIKHIMDEIKSTGAQFIRRVSDGNGDEEWEVVDDETAYKKVSHALRLRTKNESNRENGTNEASTEFHNQTGDDFRESDQKKPGRSSLPKASDSPIANNESSDRQSPWQSSLSTDPHMATGQLALENQNQAPSSLIPPATIGISSRTTSTVPSRSIDPRWHHDANIQAYWNIMCAFLSQQDTAPLFT